VLLKLSGEALMGHEPFGIDPATLTRVGQEVCDIANLGVQVSLVIGGGNIFRGVGLTASGINRISADHMGMLATVMNGIAMQDTLQKQGIDARVMSAIPMSPLCEDYTHRQAVRYLAQGCVVIFVAGTGNPCFTTDSAASLRAIEIQAHLLIKATKVNGVYTADPVTQPTAQRFAHISYDEVLTRQLAVMDLTAIVLCRDHALPLRVINIHNTGTLMRTVLGQDEGTLVHHASF
jgi:uridylate kinase